MTDTVELWLVRHGETTWNAAGKMAGWSDVPLTETGMDQAIGLRPRFESTEFRGVWSSSLIRAIHTARLAKGEPIQDERLREIHFGDLEGATWVDLDPKHKAGLTDFGNFRAPNGENIAEAMERALDFVDSLRPGRHLLFTHGGIIRILTRPLNLDRFIANGALVIVDWTAQAILEEPDGSPPFG